MTNWKLILAITMAGAVLFGCPGLALGADPLLVQVSRCVPRPQHDPSTVDPNHPTKIETGMLGKTVPQRLMDIEFGYVTRTAADDADKPGALDATTRVEVCKVESNGLVDCPASNPVSPNSDWLVFDDVDKPNKPVDATWVKSFGEPGAHEVFNLPIDWEDATNQQTVLFLRVNFGKANSDTNGTALQLGGWCPVPTKIVESPHFTVYGRLTTTSDPMAGAHGNVCTEGNKSGVNSPVACVDPIAPLFVVGQMGAIADWQDARMFAFAPTPFVTPPVWANGSTQACAGNYCPTLVWMYASDFKAHPGRGEFRLGGDQGVSAAPAPQALSPAAGADIGVMAHEYFHNLEFQWGEVHGTKQQEDLPFFETAPLAVDGYLCLFNYAGLQLNQCASPRKMGVTTKGSIGEMNNWLQTPENDPVNWHYVGSAFWRYVVEQYAIPLAAPGLPPRPAHPSGTDSIIQATTNSPLGGRPSDEGTDLMGRMFEGFAQTPSDPTLDVVDQVLKDNLGRGLDAVALDMHTAALLKDYSTDDLRWFYQWVGDHNAGAPAALIPGAPVPALSIKQLIAAYGGKLPVPGDLVGSGDDYLRRARRELDNYAACAGAGCTPTRIPLLPGQGVANTQLLTLQSFGASYLSINPGPGLGAVRVRLKAKQATNPRFRIFLVDANGAPEILPGCNIDPDNQGADETGVCPVDTTGTFDGLVSVGAWDEVLVVVSAGRKPVAFDYVIGEVDPRLEILDPLQSRQAQIGTPAEPRPFITQFVLRDENNEPLGGLAPSDFVISLPNCAGPAAPACVLENGVDYEIISMGPGLYWALGTVPTDFYPAVLPASLDLQVVVNVLGTGIVSDSESDALVMAPNTKVVTQFVLDRSTSMDDFGKLDAMKAAAKLLSEAMIDIDEVGLVTFNNDAQTLIGNDAQPFIAVTNFGRLAFAGAVQGITTGNGTSIGDGVLEGQSNLALAYGDVPPLPGAPAVIQHMIVMSDGMQNAPYAPRTYYLDGFSPDDNTDGPDELPNVDPDPADNLPWYSGNLAQWQRKNAADWLPLVSGIAIGKDADVVELSNLAEAGGGVFAYSYDDPPVPVPSIETLHLLEFADVFRTVMNRATGHERVLTTRTATPAPQDLPVISVEPGASELLVSLLSSLGDPNELGFRLRLVAPNGQRMAAVQSTPGLVFRVAQPMPGPWRWEWEHFGTPPPVFQPLPDGQASTFVEAALRGGDVTLLTRVSPTHGQLPTPTANATENAHWVGLDLMIRAVALDGLALRNVSVTADIERPSGSTKLVQLLDDGKHGDGVLDDGVYARRYFLGTEPGVYRIRIVATGLSANGSPFTREKWEAIELHDGPDDDGDGLPNWWELENGTDASTPDGQLDADADGLSNSAEFDAHTHPQQSDTDGGGETDGSEIELGQDPHESADDSGREILVAVVPCNNTVQVSFAPPSTAGTLNVQRAPSKSGPFITVANVSLPVPGRTSTTIPATNDQPGCYRTRFTTANHVSPWSPIACVTARKDPNPPVAEPSLPDGKSWTRTRRVEVQLNANDSASRLVDHQPVCTDAATSGVKDMLVSLRADFVGSTWQPVTPSVTVDLTDRNLSTIWVKVRDAAGNESTPQMVVARIALQTQLDQAISLEERALDRTNSNQLPAARSLIHDSLQPIENTWWQVLHQITHDHKLIAIPALVELTKISALKKKAWALMFQPTKTKARQALQDALLLERQLAEWAEEHGVAL